MQQCLQCRRSLESELLSAPGTSAVAIEWTCVRGRDAYLSVDVLLTVWRAVLGESYVLLPTASASQSMLLLQKLPASAGRPPEMDESGVFGEDLYTSARYNLSLQQQHEEEQRKQQAQRRQKLQQRQRRREQKLRDGYIFDATATVGTVGGGGHYCEPHVGHTRHDRESSDPAMDDSLVAVPTYADLSHHVRLLTMQQAHW